MFWFLVLFLVVWFFLVFLERKKGWKGLECVCGGREGRRRGGGGGGGGEGGGRRERREGCARQADILKPCQNARWRVTG